MFRCCVESCLDSADAPARSNTPDIGPGYGLQGGASGGQSQSQLGGGASQFGASYTFADLGTQASFGMPDDLHTQASLGGLFDRPSPAGGPTAPLDALDYSALYDDRGAAFASQGTQDFTGLASQDLPPYP